MNGKYDFEKSISENMPTPSSELAVHALNAGFAALVRALNDNNSGFANQVLENFDKIYAQNEGNSDFQLALAQLGLITKRLSLGE